MVSGNGGRPAVIHLFGASGSGTTTLGRFIAGKLRYKHMDTDDYYWLPVDPPFTQKRTPEERLRLMREEIAASGGAVISGSLCGWGDPLIPAFTLAVRVVTDTFLRIHRLRQRELGRFGPRVEQGGDMAEEHLAFLEWAAQYDDGPLSMRSRALHDRWQRQLGCPVVTVNGAQPLEESWQAVRQALEDMRTRR